jgi:hypothetical protein
MGRGTGVEAGGTARAFMRPLAMLAVGAAAGIAMWTMLMADDGRVPAGRTGMDHHEGVLRTVLTRLAPIAR